MTDKECIDILKKCLKYIPTTHDTEKALSYAIARLKEPDDLTAAYMAGFEKGKDSEPKITAEWLDKVLPKWEPAHTYASENADIYRAYDKGYKDCLADVKKAILEGKR